MYIRSKVDLPLGHFHCLALSTAQRLWRAFMFRRLQSSSGNESWNVNGQSFHTSAPPPQIKWTKEMIKDSDACYCYRAIGTGKKQKHFRSLRCRWFWIGLIWPHFYSKWTFFVGTIYLLIYSIGFYKGKVPPGAGFEPRLGDELVSGRYIWPLSVYSTSSKFLDQVMILLNKPDLLQQLLLTV